MGVLKEIGAGFKTDFVDPFEAAATVIRGVIADVSKFFAETKGFRGWAARQAGVKPDRQEIDPTKGPIDPAPGFVADPARAARGDPREMAMMRANNDLSDALKANDPFKIEFAHRWKGRLVAGWTKEDKDAGRPVALPPNAGWKANLGADAPAPPGVSAAPGPAPGPAGWDSAAVGQAALGGWPRPTPRSSPWTRWIGCWRRSGKR